MIPQDPLIRMRPVCKATVASKAMQCIYFVCMCCVKVYQIADQFSDHKVIYGQWKYLLDCWGEYIERWIFYFILFGYNYVQGISNIGCVLIA